MLSKKLTFSLASLVVLLIAGLCLPVAAQNANTTVISLSVGADGITIASGAHLVYGNDDDPDVTAETPTAGLGFLLDGAYEQQTGTDNTIRDLEEFFRFGGTIELVVHDDSPLMWHELVISEIMWGLDDGIADPTGRQWIEIYNASDGSIGITDPPDAFADPEAEDVGPVYLIFTPFGRASIATDEAVFQYINAPRRDSETGPPAVTLLVGVSAVAAGTRVESDDDYTHRVIDRVSNVELDRNLEFRSRWTMPGQSGNTDPPEDNNEPPLVSLISASRKINYSAALASGVPAGHEEDKWEATNSLARRGTISNLYQANPGTGLNPTTYISAAATPEPPADMIVINEVRNSDNDDLDWIEIKNVTAPGTDPIQIENWEITRYTGGVDAVTMLPTGDTDIVDLPKYKLGPQEILLIVNRDPSETELAGGVDLDILIDTNAEQLQKGATHLYIVRDTLVLDGTFLLLLRTAIDKNNTHETIHDAAGTLETVAYQNDRDAHTEVAPFRNYITMGVELVGGSVTDGDTRGVFGRVDNNHTAWSRIPQGVVAGHYIAKVTNGLSNGRDKDAWHKVSGTGAFGADWATSGVGYDRGVDLDFSPGTPGYENMIANTVDDFVSTQPDPDGMEYQGMISISEIMFDAGPRWNLVQWIELYNNSMTQTVDLTGWELEIRNAKEDVESYVDSVFTFVAEGNPVILPNQTLLVVSGGGTNDVSTNRVYNLYEHHRRQLGLTTRRSVLLSPTGFYMKLTDRKDLDRDSREDEDVLVDEAGNVMVDGAARHVQWALPDVEANDVRKSIVRQYGLRYTPQGGDDPDNIRYQPDGGEAPNVGNPTTAEVEASPNGTADFWLESDIVGAGISFYGHRDDISTPGYRTGGPLPVSLSSFRPVRSQVTGYVDITWITQSELNNAGFNILRSETKDGAFKVINVKGIVAGHGTTSEKHVYKFTDTTAKPNVVYYYQIEDVSLNGNRTTLRTTHLRGNVTAGGKLTTTWSNLKLQK